MKLNLQREVRYLKGVGPKRAVLFRRLGIENVYDLLYHIPRRYIDRRNIPPIKSLPWSGEATVQGQILTKGVKRVKNRRIFTVIIGDGTDWMELIWFDLPQLDKLFRIGDNLIASGRISNYKGTKQIPHPEYEFITPEEREFLTAGRIIPIYPSTEGLKPRFIRRLIYNTLKELEGSIEENLPPTILKRRGLIDRRNALWNIHFPPDFKDAQKAEKRLAYEESFYFFLHLGKKTKETLGKGEPLSSIGSLTNQFLKNLNFELTGDQKRVITEIETDLKRAIPMHRLLQGDVGSGKTVVAVYTMLIAVENGYQACMMAPTEILSEQHYLVLKDILKGLPVNIDLLIGGQRKKEREKILKGIKKGETHITVGTHALIQEDVLFKNLRVAIVDEQHRFGVLQRTDLLRKGGDEYHPHFLVMTATPIPRSLALTLYGDLELSIIKEKPPNRGTITTRWTRENKRETVYNWLFDKLKEDNQAYVVAPLIEKSGKLEVQAAVELFNRLKQIAPSHVSCELIHGRIKREERQKIMSRFRRKEFNLLVATTVIEVGIDVKTANIMVIEHAERFGLSQLHQLRGRIGRGMEKSYCILITPQRVSEDAEKRLKIFEETFDGFEIAEEDLRIRGPGELTGTRQHGLPDFKVVDLIRHHEIIKLAREDAETILEGYDSSDNEEIQIIQEELMKREKVNIYVG